MEVRERIRINGKPLSKEKFSKYFFDCWDNLSNNGDVSNQGTLLIVLSVGILVSLINVMFVS